MTPEQLFFLSATQVRGQNGTRRKCGRNIEETTLQDFLEAFYQTERADDGCI